MEQSSTKPKSKEEDYALIKRALSPARFDSFRATPEDTDELAFARYQWNAEMSECFYAALTVLEVVMRNSFSEAIAANFGNPNWLTTIPTWLHDEERDSVRNSLSYLAERGQPITQDRMVQEINFGFWTTLLSRSYEVRIFRNISARAFPGMPGPLRTRDNAARRIERIRKLRNRIYHYRRIWNRTDLLGDFDGILEAIDWLNPKVRELLIPKECRQRFLATLARRP